MRKIITVQSAIADFEIEQMPDGKQRTHSLKFWLSDGRERFVPKGIKTGVNNLDMGGNDIKGVLPVDKFLKPVGHPIPFKWYNLFEFNGCEVKL